MAFTTIDDPSAYFTSVLWTGDGNDDRSITNSANAGDFATDWVWAKKRNAGTHHALVDTSRGATKNISTSLSNAESTQAEIIQAFESNGFQIGTDADINANNDTYVAWQWKCNGGTTETAVDESGSNPANVRQTNTDAGFSIITYTGTGSAGTIAHGLGAVPHLIITKQRSNAENWAVYHHENTSAPATDYLLLNATSATADNSNRWNDEAPTTNVFTVGSANEVNTNDRTYVAYVFTEKQGYSRFGNFIGNGTTDGGFVYTGFKPAWLMIKETVSGGGWGIWDNKRMPFNTQSVERLLANSNNAADTSNDNRIDFLSNGFKVRTSSGGFNQDATTMLYIAFAESPFTSSEGVPTTAR